MRQASAAHRAKSLFRSPRGVAGRPRGEEFSLASSGSARLGLPIARTTAAAATAGASCEAACRGLENRRWSVGLNLRSLSTGPNVRVVSRGVPSCAPSSPPWLGRSDQRLLRRGALPLVLCVCGYSCWVGTDFLGTAIGAKPLSGAAAQLEPSRDDDDTTTASGDSPLQEASAPAVERPSSTWAPSFDLKDLWSNPSEGGSRAAASSTEDDAGTADSATKGTPQRSQTRGIHTSASAPSPPPSSSPSSSSTSSGWENMYARLARDAMAFVTGGSRSKDAAIQDLVEQVRTKRDRSGGDIEDKTSFSSILSLLRQQVLGDLCDGQSHDEIQAELQRVADKYFGSLQLSTTLPSALWAYLEHEDERKNPSWKRRVHRFCPGIYMDQLEEFYRGLLLAWFAYGDTSDEIRTNLEKQGYELLHCDLSSAPGKPAHYVAVQRKHESANSWFSVLSSSAAAPSPFSASVLPVVIVVRGTKTLADAMTDLLCDSCEYRGGRAHSYIVTSGKYLAETQAPLLKELATLSGLDLQVTLIGHSLGAGAATIAGIELASRDGDQYKVNVVGFGCPALLSRDLAESVSSFVTTIINDADVVPRMSGASIANLLRDVSAFDWFPYARRDIQYALNELFPAQIAKSIMEKIEPPLKSLVESSRQEPPSSEDRVTPELYPPGRCIHFYSDGIGTSAAVVRNDFFKEIDVSRRMIEDHLFFPGYQRMMLSVMRDYRQDHNFKFASDA